MATKGSIQTMRTMRTKIAMLRNFKAQQGCQRCGESHPACLDFHHKNPAEKHWLLKNKSRDGKLFRGGSRWGGMSYAAILDEIAKCEIVCANCHRKETFVELNEPPLYEKTNPERRSFVEGLAKLASS